MLQYSTVLMPKTTSAKKALRQSERRRAGNLSRKNVMKTQMKRFKKLVSEGKIDEAKVLLPRVMKTVDKTAKTGYIKKGRASRIKSRLSRKLTTKK